MGLIDFVGFKVVKCDVFLFLAYHEYLRVSFGSEVEASAFGRAISSKVKNFKVKVEDKLDWDGWSVEGNSILFSLPEDEAVEGNVVEIGIKKSQDAQLLAESIVSP